MMNFAIYSRKFKKSKHEKLIELFVKLTKQHNNSLKIHQRLFDQLPVKFIKRLELKSFKNIGKPSEFDMIFSLGGDGTLLDTLTVVKDKNVPILGINTGRLGFLTAIDASLVEDYYTKILNGKYQIEKRSLLALNSSEPLFDFQYALNDFVVHKKDTSSMITIKTYLDNELLNTYWADGLIISTPTGSTGYNLSAGGPIQFPNSDSWIITPIAPHNLNVRPVVINDSTEISFDIDGRSEHFLASLDSRSRDFKRGIKLSVKKADFKINLVRFNNDFMETLRNKLMWGKDQRN